MPEQNPVISPAAAAEDIAMDTSLRPHTLKDYQGQPAVHEQMEIFIHAARGQHEQRPG